VLYGEGFDPQTRAILAGPVYSLTNLTTPLCSVSQGQCPAVTLAAGVNASGTAMGFNVPGSTAPGVYYVLAQTGAGQQTGVGQYLMVQTPSVTYPAVPTSQKLVARPLLPGQAIQGTFVENSDPSGKTSDMNAYYFFGTAGSTITVDLQRADTSLPWEHPDALDPQLRVTAPDGLVYANLRQIDNQPGVDLNATLPNAVLPQTGIYFIAAETTKGGGNYTLNFSFGSVAPVSGAARTIPFLGNYNTAAVNTTISSTATMLDPRGYPLAGAAVTFAPAPASDDLGALEFPGGASVHTTGEGFAIIRTLLTRPGKVEFAPVISDVHLQRLRVASAVPMEIPRFAPVASAPVHVTEILAGGLLRVEEGPRKELPARDHKHALYVHGKEANAKRVSKAVPISTSLPEELKRPLPATGLKALGSLDELAITSCSPSIFVQAGVNTGTVTPPLTVTFTDETPATGQTMPVGVLSTADGIKGHRIQKTIRLKIDIKDGTGLAPAYPVLVHLSVGGPRHGTLILDPDGSRIRCDQATFLWHERDSNGNIIAFNEEFQYQLGTFSSIAGFVADPANPGKAKPVWSLGETLNVGYGVIDASGTVTLTTFEFPVQPEPGKPDHFVGNATSHDPTGNVIELWSDYGTYEVVFPPEIAAAFAEFNAYYLNDQFDNPTFGYVNTSGASGLPNVTVALADQTSGDPTIGSDVDFFGYHISVVWTDNPSMPQGNQAASITASYPNDPDGDWTAGQVTKNITLQFDRGNFHFVQLWPHYEATLPDGTPGVDDGPFPFTVTPGADTTSLPTTAAGDSPRLVLLTLTGTQFPLLLPNGDGEPFPDGHKYWQRSCPDGATCPPYVYATYQTRDPHDPRLEVLDSPAFTLALVDTKGNVITDGAFQVDLCPRYDHDSPNPPDQPGRECTIAPVQSTNGVISNPPITVNPNGPGTEDSRGYIGVELVKAPQNPGDYSIDVKSLGQNYRLREESNLFTNGEYQSAFAFVTVQGGEFLDESFRHIDPYVVDQPMTAYFRYVSDSTLPAGSQVVVRSASAADTAATLGTVTLSLTRLGSSNRYLTPAFTLTPPAAGPTPASIRVASVSQVLPVVGPLTYLFPTISGASAGKGRAVAGDIPIKTEWRYAGDGRSVSSWVTLTSNREVFLADDLRLSAQLPVGWPIPQSYLWKLTIDGQAYTPSAGVDLTQPSILLAVLDRAGKLQAEVTLTFSTEIRTGRTVRDIWLETAATAVVTWIDTQLINLDVLFPGTPYKDCPTFAWAAASALVGIPNLGASPDWPDDFNAAALKYGAISAPPLTFDTENDLLLFINEHYKEYKEAQGVRFQTRVLDGRILTTWTGHLAQGRELLKRADVGMTDGNLPCAPLLGGWFKGDVDLAKNQKSFELFTSGSTGGFFTLNKGRIGGLGKALYNAANCFLRDCTPYIWTKSVFSSDSPYPRTDWLPWTTSFPTAWLYYSTNAPDGGRQYPISRQVMNPQVGNPKSFLKNPEPE